MTKKEFIEERDIILSNIELLKEDIGALCKRYADSLMEELSKRGIVQGVKVSVNRDKIPTYFDKILVDKRSRHSARITVLCYKLRRDGGISTLMCRYFITSLDDIRLYE